MQSAKSVRLPALDALRGLIMVIMALDHVRDFFHSAAQSFPPDDLARTTPAIFLTRWITHFCAPVFMLTAGASAALWQRNAGITPHELSLFLLRRGFWLVLLDITVLRFGMNFNLQVPLVILNVLWALGWSMVILAAISRLPRRLLAGLCVAVISLHNLLDPVRGGALWKILHQPGAMQVGPYTVIAGYSIVPWFAVMALGFCMGPLFVLPAPARRRWLARTGLAATCAFLLLRTVNVYGDPSPWRGSVLSFLRTTKYPPSLEFLLMTIGPALLLLAGLDRLMADREPAGGAGVLVTFGHVPLFYFLGHFYLAHLAAVVLAWFHYGHAGFALNPTPAMGSPRALYPADYGYGLPGVYLIWIAIVLLMYPACLWFGPYKQRHGFWWLRYL